MKQRSDIIIGEMHPRETTCVAVLCLPFAMAIDPAVATEPDYIESEAVVVAGSINSPLDYAFESPVFFSRLRESLDASDPFSRESSLDLNFRTYWFQRDNESAPNSEALAAGGELLWRSGWYRELLSAELGGFTSQKLYGPKDKDGAGLLQPEQDGYSVLGKANVQVQFADTRVVLYRSELNTPFANKEDVRMTQNTFENYHAISNDLDNLDLLAGYVTAYKPRTEDGFIDLLEGIAEDSDKDMIMFGGRYQDDSDTASVGAIAYQVEDYLRIWYGEGQKDFDMPVGKLNLAGQLIKQDDTGHSVGGEIETRSYGLKSEYSLAGSEFTLAWHRVSGDSMRSHWGAYPGYNYSMMRAFNRADEESFRVGFKQQLDFVVEGFSFFANYVWSDTPDSGSKQSPDEQEFDLTVDYRSENQFLRNVHFRFRYARVWQDYSIGSGELEDIRFIINYQLPLF